MRIGDEIVKLHRYAKYLFEYLFLEVPRGLDFTMRDISLGKKSNGKYNGYSKTNEKHLKVIYDQLNISNQDAIIDIGCGKGVVLREAAKYPFAKISGIDIQQYLVDTANKNFKILKLSDRISCECTNAVEYDKYGDYNYFFFFNPFDEEIFLKVIENIVHSCEGKKINIICHNPVFHESLMKTGLFVLKDTLYDKTKHYYTNIYTSKFEVNHEQ